MLSVYSLSDSLSGYLQHLPGSGEEAGLYEEMVLLTMIARLADGLPLAASMQEDEQVKKKKRERRKTLSCVVSGFYDVCLLALLMASSLNGAKLEKKLHKIYIGKFSNNLIIIPVHARLHLQSNPRIYVRRMISSVVF